MEKRRYPQFKKWISFFGFFLLFLNAAYAVDIPGAISTFSDPGRVSRELAQPEQPAPLRAAPVREAQQPESRMPPEAAKIKFKLTKVIFIGNTVFSSAELMRIFSSSLNKTISLAELDVMVQEVTKKYRSAGYVLSRALLPPQEIKHGAVKVQVVEGFISKVDITGNPGRLRPLLQKYMDPILQSKPFQISILERQMLYANDIPGANVKAILTPSKDIPGSADLSLVVEQKRFAGIATYDDYGTRFIGPQQFSLAAIFNSILFGGDSTTGRFVGTSDKNQLKYFEVVHSEVVGAQGTNFLVGTNYTQTEPDFLLEGLDIVGRSFSVYGNVFFPVIRSRSKNFTWRGVANYQNVTSTLVSQPFYQDRIRSLTGGISFDTIDGWQGVDTLQFDLSHGFPIFGAHNHVLQSRVQGNTDYTKFVLNVSRLQPLPGRYSIYTSAQGQYAFNALLTTEQFAFGGPNYGRGYGPSEIIGDRGVAAKVEARADANPSWRLLQSIQYYLFYDFGMVWNIDHVNLPARVSATSTGLGARMNFIPQLSGEVYLAKPLTHKALTLTPLDQNPFQARVFFQLVARI